MKRLTKKAAAELDKDAAEHILQVFDLILDEARYSARRGDGKDAQKFMRTLITRDWVLRRLGYMTDDEGELTKFKPWNGKS